MEKRNCLNVRCFRWHISYKRNASFSSGTNQTGLRTAITIPPQGHVAGLDRVLRVCVTFLLRLVEIDMPLVFLN